MTQDEYYDKISEISEMSTTVASYIDTQSFRVEYDDEVDIQDLMLKCYAIIIGELRELGIVLVIDFEDALANTYDADGYLALYKLLDTDYLITQFKSYPDVQDAIRNIFSNTDDNNTIDEDESFYLKDFIEIYKKFSPHNPYISKVSRIIDTVVSNNLFRKHIEAILEASIPTSDINEENSSMIFTYIKKIYRGMQYFKEVVTHILSIDKTLDRGKLHQAIELYDLEKVTGLDMTKFAWAVMSKDEELTDREKSIKESILNRHKTHQTHHIEYFIANRLHPTKENLVELTSHHVEEGSTRDSFIKEVSSMILTANKYKLLTEEDISYIKYLVSIILPKYYPNQELEISIEEDIPTDSEV